MRFRTALMAFCFLTAAGRLPGQSLPPTGRADTPAHQSSGRLQPADYRDVTLTGGPLAEQAQFSRDFYLAIPNDNLLNGFRQRAGLPAPGRPMGGWYRSG